MNSQSFVRRSFVRRSGSISMKGFGASSYLAGKLYSVTPDSIGHGAR
jgi:hypothetical protein